MSKGKLMFGVAAGLCALYLIAAPYIVVYQLKAAAESRDGEALAEYIDFPSVRQSFKDQINVMLAKELANDEMAENPFAALGTAFATGIVERMVDAYVTPAGMAQLMSGEEPSAAASAQKASDTKKEPFSGASMSYESLDKFVITIPDMDGDNGKFVLRRQGLGWKLTEIIVPLD